MRSPWDDLLPPTRGTLPGGAPLRRTDPSGNPEAQITIIGVYPAATKVRPVAVSGTRINLPVEVEAVSFDPVSASGAEIDDNYLRPLGLTRADVLITDLVPYFLANTTVSKSGRSMADNIRLFEAATVTKTGIEVRPPGEELLGLAREMPGNLDRLAEIVGRARPRLVFTLGTETAAFLRGLTFAEASERVDELLYAPPVRCDVFGVATDVIHLVHPHLFLKKNAKWMQRHRAWCSAHGRELVEASGGREGAGAGAPT